MKHFLRLIMETVINCTCMYICTCLCLIDFIAVAVIRSFQWLSSLFFDTIVHGASILAMLSLMQCISTVIFYTLLLCTVERTASLLSLSKRQSDDNIKEYLFRVMFQIQSQHAESPQIHQYEGKTCSCRAV